MKSTIDPDMRNLIRVILLIAVVMIWASLLVGAQELDNSALLAHHQITSEETDKVQSLCTKASSSILDRKLVTFDLVYHQAEHEIEVTSTERIDQLGYRIYGLEGKSISEGAMPQNGRLAVQQTASGTLIIALYRNKQVVGMKKLILM